MWCLRDHVSHADMITHGSYADHHSTPHGVLNTNETNVPQSGSMFSCSCHANRSCSPAQGTCHTHSPPVWLPSQLPTWTCLHSGRCLRWNSRLQSARPHLLPGVQEAGHRTVLPVASCSTPEVQFCMRAHSDAQLNASVCMPLSMH